jgi:hypothetical protein
MVPKKNTKSNKKLKLFPTFIESLHTFSPTCVQKQPFFLQRTARHRWITGTKMFVATLYQSQQTGNGNYHILSVRKLFLIPTSNPN